MRNSVDSGKYLSQPVRALVDLALVLLFIALGLVSHGESLSQILVTAAPFLIAAGAGHIGIWVVKSRRQLPLLLEGLMMWVSTLVLGLGLRLSFGDTAATAFVIVSAITLLLFLVGWRLILWALRRKS
ncbi:MAG: DUF3054 domain-containing protein [Rothia sp. (in: high G+C Gram-positive bacteria)]|nr:DUF3054 domain-containing protein [Rothia sp. (in: high G+C Gram-positive bacteria)]